MERYRKTLDLIKSATVDTLTRIFMLHTLDNILCSDTDIWYEDKDLLMKEVKEYDNQLHNEWFAEMQKTP